MLEQRKQFQLSAQEMYATTMKIRELVLDTAQQLIAVCPHPNSAEQEAWWLLEKLLGKSKTALLLARDVEVSDAQHAQLAAWVRERAHENKPLQYLLGNVPFCGLEIVVRPPTLIPRPETEEWTTWLIEKLAPVKNTKLEILDLCAGSGCIALALANALPHSHVTGIDLSTDAVQLSQENKAHNKIENATFTQGDLFASLDPGVTFDIIVSNPPYIDEEEWRALGDEVKEWEDKNALVAAHHGLEIYERIIATAASFLKRSGAIATKNIPQLVFEIGHEQGAAVASMLQKASFTSVSVHKDLEGKDRFVTARLA